MTELDFVLVDRTSGLTPGGVTDGQRPASTGGTDSRRRAPSIYANLTQLIPVVFARGGRVHLVKPHASRPTIEGRSRMRAICGRTGTIVAVLTLRLGLCPHCAAIEADELGQAGGTSR